MENVHVFSSIEQAIEVVRGRVGSEGEGKGGVDVLVTGSLYLVGGVIRVAGLTDVAVMMESPQI